jgi:hypothetical protein
MSFIAWVMVWQGRCESMPQQARPSAPRSLSTWMAPSGVSPEQQTALSVSQKEPLAH